MASLARQIARQTAQRDQGSALLEFALGTVVLFSLVFCFIEVCLIAYTRDTISECAREGTRYAMVRGASCPNTASPTCEVSASQVNTYVSAIRLPNLAGGTMTVATTYPDGNEAVGSRVQVLVSYAFTIRVPLVPAHAINLSSTSKVYILQ